jgi:hypothetical protein
MARLTRRGRILLALIASILALALPVGMAMAGTLTLHPAGFGEKSRANWKAGEGIDGGQAFYMQKMVPTAQFAAGVALIKGFEGQDATVLTGLEWQHRVDGHCGAGAPRWNIGLKNKSTGDNSTVFLGCYAAAHSAGDAANYCRDTYDNGAIAAAIGSPGDFTIRHLAILFDEGPDNPIAQPPGCPDGPSNAGFVFLDRIKVMSDIGTRTWDSASDNGNGSAFIGPAIAYADALPSTSDILDLLQEVVPGVPLTSWRLYPDVEPASAPIPGLP